MHILVLQHLPVEHPGTLREFWSEAGYTFRVIELDQGESVPTLEGFDLLVSMGGPMDVWQEEQHSWLLAEKTAIRYWVKGLRRPFLGICLGHQLLADALGGKVTLMKGPEVGLAYVRLTPEGQADRLLAGFPATVETFQWHGAEVSQLPPGARALASNDACAIQAFRWGEHAYGFQYHLELTENTVRDWQNIPEYATSLARALGPLRARRLDAEVKPRLAGLRDAVRLLHGNLDLLLQESRSRSDRDTRTHAARTTY